MSTVPGPNVLASNVPQVPPQDCGSVCVWLDVLRRLQPFEWRGPRDDSAADFFFDFFF